MICERREVDGEKTGERVGRTNSNRAVKRAALRERCASASGVGTFRRQRVGGAHARRASRD